MTDFRVDRIRTKTGTTINLPPAGVLCVVGGNNVGKSQLLRVVSGCLQGFQSRAIILSEVEFTLNISEDVASWARSNSVVQFPSGQPETFTPPGGGQAWQLPQLRVWLADPSGENFGRVMPWFLRSLDSAQRVGVAIGGMGQPGMEVTGNPIHDLFIDGDLETELSYICQKTFNFPLTLDRANGNVQLRVGTPGIESPPLQHPTREYAEAVARLQLLSEQGDGVKNYLGMVLHLMTSRASMTVIDEPEAFLHPAQARSLGRHLGAQALSRGLQLLTATHDRDFVLGLLEANCPVTFVRLQRSQNESSAATLSAERVKSIWDRPVLRYSNVLQGLFHRTVVVCESDSDCRWYAAVLDELGRRANFDAEEVLFVPAGGKSQIPQCVEALEGLDVGAFVALDFDALLDVPYLKTLLISVGVNGDDLLPRAANIVKQLLTPEQRARVKEFGLDGMPHGDLTRLAREFVAELRNARVLVVLGGELESFDRSIGGHGPAWVSGALAAGRHLDSPASEEFLSPIVAAVRGQG